MPIRPEGILPVRSNAKGMPLALDWHWIGMTLSESEKQIELFQKNTIKDIYLEYYIIKAGKFDDQKVSDKLDDWIYFLKNSKIPESFKTPPCLSS